MTFVTFAAESLIQMEDCVLYVKLEALKICRRNRKKIHIGEETTKSYSKINKGALMRSKFERLSKPELEFLIDNCNFSEEECKILRMASSGSSEIQIAGKMNISVSGVSKKKNGISLKINDFLEVMGEVTTIYVNGKRVTKDELKNYEIKIDSVKKMLADKLTKKK